MGDKIRLNRFLARSGICSRRGADELIKKGLVKVNGVTVSQLGTKIDIDLDKVVVDGKEIPKDSFKSKKFIYIALNKPIKVVTTLRDPQNRKTVIEILPEYLRDKGLVPVGRLDYFSEGLLLMSNDGDFVFKMTHPKFHLKKIYLVEVKGNVKKEHIHVMKKGMKLDEINYKLAPVSVSIVKKLAPDHFVLRFELMQGVNRQIRRMCHAFSWSVLRLKRIAHGPIKLGKLEPGRFRYLTKKEVDLCMEQCLKKSVPCN
ncbi:pseudouridine synthase [Desulfothermus okinawensis JCM 13304]